MKHLVIPLTAVLLFICCEKQKEQIEKFVFDSKQISRRTIHKYDFYRAGKIKTDYSITFYLMAGVQFDSIASKKQSHIIQKAKSKAFLTDWLN